MSTDDQATLRNWEEDLDHAFRHELTDEITNNRCTVCLETFTGHRSRVVCRTCAALLPGWPVALTTLPARMSALLVRVPPELGTAEIAETIRDYLRARFTPPIPILVAPSTLEFTAWERMPELITIGSNHPISTYTADMIRDRVLAGLPSRERHTDAVQRMHRKLEQVRHARFRSGFPIELGQLVDDIAELLEQLHDAIPPQPVVVVIPDAHTRNP